MEQFFYCAVLHPIDADSIANSVDSDVGAVWSGTALFAQTYSLSHVYKYTITVNQLNAPGVMHFTKGGHIYQVSVSVWIGIQ